MLRHQQPIYRFPINRKWHVVKDKDLEALKDKNPKSYDGIDLTIACYQSNRMSFFLPHGRRARSRSGGQRINDGIRFLNDRENDLKLLVASNQAGKTCHGSVDIILQMVPCDPEWPIFTQHRVRYQEWGGPKIAIVASSSWDNVQTAWEEYQKFLPRDELRQYCEGWGELCDEEEESGLYFDNEHGKARNLSFGTSGTTQLNLKCGSRIIFLCYTQKQVHWEGKKCDMAHLDEQCPEDKFDGLSIRQATRGGYTPIIMTLTGIVEDNNPDTGAGGWIKRKIVDGEATKGRKIAQYAIGMADVPEAIIDAKTKKKLYEQYVAEPLRLNDEKKQREGNARYHGGWEEGGGLVISPWSESIHLIDPFDVHKFKPCIFRVIDHGENPCAAILVALMPWGDAVIYKEYYEFGLGIAENARRMVEDFSGNTRERADEFEYAGQIWPIYKEVFLDTQISGSEMDSRSFGSSMKESGRTIGTAYNEYGCYCTPASGSHNIKADGTGLVSLMNEWFDLDREKDHINKWLEREIPVKSQRGRGKQSFGAPRLYVFNTMKHSIAEIRGWVLNPKTGKPRKTADHICSCIRYFCGRVREYSEDWLYEDYQQSREKDRSNVDELTKY